MAAAFHDARQRVIARALAGPGVASPEARRAAFDNHGVDPRVAPLLEAVATRAWEVTDADVASPIAAGLSEDEVFELVVCAALGKAQRQLDAALAALDDATRASGPAGPGDQA